MEKGSSGELEAEIEQFIGELKDTTWIERSYEAIETIRTQVERQGARIPSDSAARCGRGRR